MTDATGRLDGRWMHSFEEDHDGIQVYRPVDYPFPPARGRAGIEFRPDGTYVDWTVGRGDAPEPRPGLWEPVAGDAVRLSTAGERRLVRVVRVDPDLLEVRPAGAG